MAAALDAALRWSLSGTSALLLLCLEHGPSPESFAWAHIFCEEAGGHEQHLKHTNEDLLAMGEANFVRLVSAFEHSLAGSAQEKIHQRSDLEAMVEQIEQESLEDDAQELLQGWKEGKEVMQQLSGAAAAAGEVAELEMACAKAESLLCQVLGEEIVHARTDASGTGRCAAEGAQEGRIEGLGLRLHRKLKVMQARQRVPVRAGGGVCGKDA